MGQPGFVTTAGTAALTQGLLPVRRKAPKTETVKSLDGSVTETIRIGEGFLVVTVRPEDLRPPLRDWLSAGTSMRGEYRPNVTSIEGAVAVSFYVFDPSILNDPAWHQRPVQLRLVPTDGASMDKLLAALSLNGLAEELTG